MSHTASSAPVEHCRICASRDVAPVGRKRGRYRAVEFTFHRCRTCGFTFVSPVLGDEVYDDAYYRGQGADPSVNYEREYRDYANTTRRHELADLVRLAREHFSKAGRPDGQALSWLDFGCGAGALLKYLRDEGASAFGPGLGLECSGFDVGTYAERLAAQDGFEIWTLPELNALPDGTFDVISCIEVVEHLAQPLEVFGLLGRLLRPGGLLLLTTGNLQSPLARVLGLKFPYCTPEIHVAYYHPALLTRIYRRQGLEPVHVKYGAALRFKIDKNLPRTFPARWRDALAQNPAVQRVLDWGFGVSAMPCATKPRA